MPRQSRRERAQGFAAALFLAGSTSAIAAQPSPDNDLGDLSLDQLGNIDITSVSGRTERLSDAPASIYVITNEDIHRSGATTLPEALRLAPNLEVARVNASTYAISARGFNNALGNKLLVLIDGRIVYTPLFSGVFWDAQDVLLDDVDRIEVISGPGATLWGANAVNGVINVITRSSAKTQGVLLDVDGGGTGSDGAVRYGGSLPNGGTFRVYAKRNLIDQTHDASGVDNNDAFERDQAGFRADWGNAANGATVQGDAYQGQSEQPLFGSEVISGGNLTADWNQQASDGSKQHVLVYFDNTRRQDPLEFDDQIDTFDIEYQRDLPLNRQDIIWGLGYRYSHDVTGTGLLTTFIPPAMDLNWEDAFLQDEIKLPDAVKLTLGGRLDRNVFTGTELLPSIRLAWTPGDDKLVWGEVSRTVRAPSRIDTDFFFPGHPPFLITGGPDFVSEVADVAELGFRAQPTKSFSWSITAFDQYYENLRSGQQQSDGTFQVENGHAGTSSGVETWASLELAERWQVSAGLSVLHLHLWTRPGFQDPDGITALGNDPKYQWSLRSTFQVTPELEFNVSTRTVGALPDPAIQAYTAVDASLDWRANTHVELGVFGQNLFDAGHVEYEPATFTLASDFGRSADVRLILRW